MIIQTPTGAATNARLKSLEKASTNVQWLESKQDEIKDAFGKENKKNL